MTTPRRSNRTWAIVIVIITLAGGAVGAVVSHDIAPSYVATATVLVGDLNRPDLATDFDTSARVAVIYGGLIRNERRRARSRIACSS
jgi:capsular polysaccharide biosynthesis protein